jgi:hypothetical protein
VSFIEDSDKKNCDNDINWSLSKHTFPRVKIEGEFFIYFSAGKKISKSLESLVRFFLNDKSGIEHDSSVSNMKVFLLGYSAF